MRVNGNGTQLFPNYENQYTLFSNGRGACTNCAGPACPGEGQCGKVSSVFKALDC